ncbi:hypothetical protein QTN93_15085 [Sphingomonas aerolata]|uniref:hypothetical protein n=1 Tax=Sphingomonas aerolata TaxID=185951 RepID=UPI0035A629D2
MSNNFVFFPTRATQAATLTAGFDDPNLIAQLLPAQQAQLRVEIRQMGEWNRRAMLMLVPTLSGATASEISSAAADAQQIDQWFSTTAWVLNIDSTLSPVATAMDPARVSALAKIAGLATQQLAVINTVIGAINAATVLLTALKADAAAAPGLLAPMGIMADAAAAPAATSKPTPTATPPSAPAPQTPAAQAVAEAAATKAMYELITARVSANEALIKTVLGTIPPSTDAASKVTAGTGSGLLEGTLLTADVIDMCARKIADKVETAPKTGAASVSIILLSGKQTLEVALWRAVQARIAALRTTADDATQKVADAEQALGLRAPAADAGPAGLAIVPIAAAVTAIGTLVSNAANLASYFQTSLSTSGMAIEGVDDDLLGSAVASALAKKVKVYMPGAAADEAKAHELIQAISGLRQKAQVGKTTIEELQKARLTPTPPVTPPMAGAPATPAPAALMSLADIATAAAAIGATTAVVQACDALLTSLTTPDAAGTLPLTALSSQAALGKAVDEGAKILRVRVHKTISGVYIKESGRILAFFQKRGSARLACLGRRGGELPIPGFGRPCAGGGDVARPDRISATRSCRQMAGAAEADLSREQVSCLRDEQEE